MTNSKRLPTLEGIVGGHALVGPRPSIGGLTKVGSRSFSSAFEGFLYPLTNEEKR